MFGIVGFEDLKISCVIGINPEERDCEQDIFLSMQVESDFLKVAKNDDLTEAINYVSLSETCEAFAKQGKYQMLETLALELINHIKDKYQTNWIQLIIKKPKALKDASYSFVELEVGKKRNLN